MNIDFNKKYTTAAIYASLVIFASILFYHAVKEFRDLTNVISVLISSISPFISGFIIAYLLNFMLSPIEKHLFNNKYIKKIDKKKRRTMSLTLTYAITFLTLFFFGKFVIPQLAESITKLINDIPMYLTNLNQTINTIAKDLNIKEEQLAIIINKSSELIDFTIGFITDSIPLLGSIVKNFISSIWNVILGIIISIYLLADKEIFCASLKKITYALFPKKKALLLIDIAQKSNKTFGNFIIGKVIDSAIIGVLTFFTLVIFKIPYTVLIASIVAITNVIPFFGPFIGAIPSFIIILLASPTKALVFLIIILIIQQLDGHIIGPKILGESIGISAFWVLFSLLVAGKLLGITGMIIGVPLFAIILSIINDIINSKLAKKGLPKEVEVYIKK